MIPDPIEEVFRPLYGIRCWNVKSGYGSFLTLEFGEPSLTIREPLTPSRDVSPRVVADLARRLITVHGQWHLWVYCCAWNVTTAGKCIGHSNLRGSTKHPIDRAAHELDGQKLIGVTVNRRTCRTVFAFEMDTQLETWPYDEEGEQWMLYEPSGLVFTLRDDGWYRHTAKGIQPDDIVWKPLLWPGEAEK